MDENRRQVLTDELQAAVKERERLTAFIELLSERLGVKTPGTDSGGHAPQAAQEPATGDPVASVSEGEFYGMSAPKASRALLAKFGRTRPLKTDQIFQAIIKGGVAVKEPGTLYRSLFRDESFHRVGRGLWGLSEWYPNAKRDAKAEPPNGSPAGADTDARPEDLGPDTDDPGPSPEGSAEP